MHRAVLSDEVSSNHLRIVQVYRPVLSRDEDRKAIVGIKKLSVVEVGRVLRAVRSMTLKSGSQCADVGGSITQGAEGQVDWTETSESSCTVERAGQVCAIERVHE